MTAPHSRAHRGASDVWLTPPEWIAALGPFDLDPCAAIGQPWSTALKMLTLPTNGLVAPWHGRVWLNPPMGPESAGWYRRMMGHGSGIALAFVRSDTPWFQDSILGASGVLFVRGRPHFHHGDGRRARHNSGGPICLAAYSTQDVDALLESGIPGVMREGEPSLTGKEQE